MAFNKYKCLTKRSQSDKVLRDKTFEIASNPTYDGYQRELVQWFLSFLIKYLLAVI